MIHLIVGNTGSGKTTYSEKLKTETGGVIFSIDKWNKTLFLPDKSSDDGLQWFLERIDRAEKMILSLVDQLEESGVDSILDLGLSKYSHRQKFRDYANRKGFELKLHYLDISKEIRLERVLQRNREKGSTFEFEVSRENFEFMEEWFEKPTEQELLDAVVIKA
jgi:predicted kinase